MAANELEVVQHPQIPGISIFFDTVEYRSAHSHSELEILLVLENSLVVTCDQKQFTVEPGSFLIFNPGQLHEFHKKNTGCTFLCLQISLKTFSFAIPHLEHIVFQDLLPENTWDKEEMAFVKHDFFDLAYAYFYRKPNYEMYCTGKSALLLHFMLNTLKNHIITQDEEAEQVRKNARIQRLIDFVDKNYTHKIRLADFAEEENRSLSYLSHFIKDTMGQNFQTYVNSVRFNAACKLMKESNMRLLDICMETGFSDYRYFAETFRFYTNSTPEEYRKQLPLNTEEVKLHHSIHSQQSFYTREKSFDLWEKYKQIFL